MARSPGQWRSCNAPARGTRTTFPIAPQFAAPLPSNTRPTYGRLYPETAITIFYIDIRTPGRLEEFAARVEQDAGIRLVKGKVAEVEENPATGDLLVTAEDALAGRKSTQHFELVVLATGIVPQTEGLPLALHRDEFGFLNAPNGSAGLYAAGCVRRPADVSSTVQDATGAALKALQCANRSVCHAW